MQYLIHTLLCGDHPTIKELIDYDQFCGIQPAPAQPVGNPDEVTVQGMKKALNNPSLGIKVIDVRSPGEIGAAAISWGKPTNTRSRKWTACRCCR